MPRNGPKRDPARMETHERDLHRLSQLYHADCAFFLGDYESAVVLYDRVARRYADHHSSIYALVQVVNAYNALGDSERAAAAHERTLARLGQMREGAFDAIDALMDREAWERWLQSTPFSKTMSAVEVQ
jgi:tetratricopeptide (TPR) repeat protein